MVRLVRPYEGPLLLWRRLSLRHRASGAQGRAGTRCNRPPALLCMRCSRKQRVRKAIDVPPPCTLQQWSIWQGPDAAAGGLALDTNLTAVSAVAGIAGICMGPDGTGFEVRIGKTSAAACCHAGVAVGAVELACCPSLSRAPPADARRAAAFCPQASSMPDPSITPLLNSSVSSSGFTRVNGTHGPEYITR